MFADDTNLRNRVTLVQLDPVKAIEPVEQWFAVRASRWNPVFLWPCLPNSEVSGFVLNSAVIFEQHIELGRSTGTRRTRQNITVITYKLVGHQIAQGHALHEDAPFVYIVFLLHALNETKQEVHIVIVLDILCHRGYWKIGHGCRIEIIKHALNRPHSFAHARRGRRQ